MARARHECVHGGLKHWRILKEVFCHDLSKHGLVFIAVANIEQLLLMEGGMWQVDYNDRINNDIIT